MVSLNNEEDKIGICGWGTVATALHRSILENKNQIKRTHQVDLEIVAIGARRDNLNTVQVKQGFRNIFDVLDEDIDVLVELIGGTDDAKTLISSAFEKKIPVVTANKAVIYEYGDILFREASNNGVDFLLKLQSVLELQQLICLKMTLLEINFCLSKACLMEHLTLLFLKWKME